MYRLLILSVGVVLFIYYVHVITYLFGLCKRFEDKEISLKSLIPFYYWFNL